MTRPKRPLSSYDKSGSAAWPESELFPRRLFEDKLGDLAPEVIEQIMPAWRDYKAHVRMRAHVGSPAEQVAAARDLGEQCLALAQLLRTVDLQHVEATAALHCHRRGVNLDDEKAQAAAGLLVVGAAYLAAAAKGPPPLSAKPSRQSRDELARVVLTAVEPHVKRQVDAAVYVDAVLNATGADCPSNIERYARRLRRR